MSSTTISVTIEESGADCRVVAAVNGHEVRTTSLPRSTIERELVPMFRALVRGRSQAKPPITTETEAKLEVRPTFAWRCRGTRHLRLGVRPYGKATVGPGKREPCPGCPDCDDDFKVEEPSPSGASTTMTQLGGVDNDDLRQAFFALQRALGPVLVEQLRPVTPNTLDEALRRLDEDGRLRAPMAPRELVRLLGSHVETNSSNPYYKTRLVRHAMNRVFGSRFKERGNTNSRRFWVQP